MQKPAETKKLYVIAAILYASHIALDCLLFPIAAVLSGTRSSVHITPGIVVIYYLPYMLALVFPLLAVWLSRQKEITPQSTKLTAILLPSCWIVLRLLNLGFRMLAKWMLEAAQFGAFAILQNTVRIPLYLSGLAGTAGFLLLCCACAEEFVLTHPAPDGTKHLSQYAGICADAGLLLQIVSTLLSEQFGLLFGSGHLVLPMKWKLVLIGVTLLEAAPFTVAAIWFWLKPESIRPVTKLILAPILYFVPALLGYVTNQFLPLLVAQEGMESIAAYSSANTISGFFTVLNYAALILTCCAGTIALFKTKLTPSDGAISNH